MKHVMVLGLFVISMFLLSAVRGAEDLGTLKTRISQRRPQVENLKSQGVIGENNLGFLDVRGVSDVAANLVADENRDREAVYSALAQKTNVTSTQVGKARARQIAQRAKAGEWIQDENGVWKKK